MNLRFLLPLLLALLPAVLHAEDTSASDIDLTGDQGTYEQKTGSGHVWGNVHLVQPGVLDLRCDDFVFQQGTNSLGKRVVDQIIATTNVVLLTIQPASGGQLFSTNRALAFQAVFNGNNNTVRLTGSPETGQPRYETPEGVITAAILTYDRISGGFKGEQGFHLSLKASVLRNSSLFGPRTNSPAAR